MRTIHETVCITCKTPITVTEDDNYPRCDECRELENLIKMGEEFLSGELVLPNLPREEVDEADEDEDD